MRVLVAVVPILCACLAAAGSVAAAPKAPSRAAVTLPWTGLSVGVNDDSGKLASMRDWFYPTMADEGLKVNTLTLQWDETDPFTIPAKGAVQEAIAAAQSSGVTTELDLYPLHSQALTDGKKCKPSTARTACGDSATIQEFAGWTAQVAAAFPSVRQFVVMNECNQPLFVNPQWDRSGHNQSAEICGRALAAAYDAIKGANPSNFVWGVGLSPRGNDNARATTNSSTSPVRFLGYLGAWFKAFAKKTHRTAPLMDGLDFHPYPVPQSLPFAIGYSNPRDASVTNLSRVYQAFYDAFNGSPQRTIGQQKGGGLPVSLNETGIQTTSPGSAYFGWEVSATTAGGVLGQWATQAYQSKWYLAMLSDVACDPNVRLVNIFHLVDEINLAGWQSGLYYADETPKQSATVVESWLTSTGATCLGKATPWIPGAKLTLPVVDLSKLKLPGSAFTPPAVSAVAPLPFATTHAADPSPALTPASPPVAVVPAADPAPTAPTDGASAPADAAPADDTAAPAGDASPPADNTPPPADQPPPAG
jgi:hypothetical protein